MIEFSKHLETSYAFGITAPEQKIHSLSFSLQSTPIRLVREPQHLIEV